MIPVGRIDTFVRVELGYASLSKWSASDEQMDVATVSKGQKTWGEDDTRLSSCFAMGIESVSKRAET